MRLPGYRRRGPDPVTTGVMAPGRVVVTLAGLPRLRFHPFCLFRHKPDHYRLWASGERWSTFIYTCLRCNRVVGDSHAVRSDEPRV